MIKNDWYKRIWNLDIKNMSWTEKTKEQVDFIIDLLDLNGTEKILDIGCGYGRHSLEFAKRGYKVTGVDITEDYISDAKLNAEKENLNADFLLMDVRDIEFSNEFDVVLNLADGAIGYLEDENENIKIFDVISKALKSGGKHFMDICSGDHANSYFPKKTWAIGEKEISLTSFEWNEDSKRMLLGGMQLPFGEKVDVITDINYFSTTRLYSIDEVKNILNERGMEIVRTVSDFCNKEYEVKNLQLQVYSVKN